eukprot:CAMPEP_0172200474 /NCGR_PEP_ID=MMETSP1050-20130122/29350_1 /TAXON_ID=233186 /ORGANISM="Cryptomonas curvata, Strain CCAP979/52" /LENGTH=42 /DNA_ID= /DNA_START= /DNA_END= /DNA_ORIENTATION=
MTLCATAAMSMVTRGAGVAETDGSASASTRTYSGLERPSAAV